MSSSSMPKARTCSAFVETATKWAPTASSPSRSTSQRAGGAGVGQRLGGRERLRADDEQRPGGVEAGQRRLEVGAVDVGDEAGVQRAVEAAAQGAHDHARTEVGAADADVDDGREALAGRTGALAGPHAAGEGLHAAEHLLHLCRDVLAVDDERRVGRPPQRGVQDRAVLGAVDVLAGEHRLDALRQPALARRRRAAPSTASSSSRCLEKSSTSVAGLHRQPLGAVGVLVEQLAQGGPAQSCGVRLELGEHLHHLPRGRRRGLQRTACPAAGSDRSPVTERRARGRDGGGHRPPRRPCTSTREGPMTDTPQSVDLGRPLPGDVDRRQQSRPGSTPSSARRSSPSTWPAIRTSCAAPATRSTAASGCTRSPLSRARTSASGTSRRRPRASRPSTSRPSSLAGPSSTGRSGSAAHCDHEPA